MISFKQYLHAKNQLPKNTSVDLSSMTEKDKGIYEKTRQKHLQELIRKQKRISV